MTRIVNHVMNVLYPALVFVGVLLAWDVSGQSQFANLNLPPVSGGFIPWTPTLPIHSTCDQQKANRTQ
jgi:hypothetical protein